jgi:hypothetical protein
VIVRVADPVFVCFFVESVSTEDPDDSAAGLNDATTNFGSAPTERDTVPVKPEMGVIVTV